MDGSQPQSNPSEGENRQSIDGVNLLELAIRLAQADQNAAQQNSQGANPASLVQVNQNNNLGPSQAMNPTLAQNLGAALGNIQLPQPLQPSFNQSSQPVNAVVSDSGSNGTQNNNAANMASTTGSLPAQNIFPGVNAQQLLSGLPIQIQQGQIQYQNIINSSNQLMQMLTGNGGDSGQVSLNQIMNMGANPSFAPAANNIMSMVSSSLMPLTSSSGQSALIGDPSQSSTTSNQTLIGSQLLSVLTSQSTATTTTTTTTNGATFSAIASMPGQSTANDSDVAVPGVGLVRKRTKRKYEHESFPQKLHRLIRESKDKGKDHIVRFTDDGGQFQILHTKSFEDEILGNYFRHNRISSFKRLLRMYGFRRVNGTWMQGTFEHPLFKRDFPQLCKQMDRVDNSASKDNATNSSDQDRNSKA